MKDKAPAQKRSKTTVQKKKKPHDASDSDVDSDVEYDKEKLRELLTKNRADRKTALSRRETEEVKQVEEVEKQ